MLVTLATSKVNRREENINTARYPSLKVAPGSNSQSLVQIQTFYWEQELKAGALRFV